MARFIAEIEGARGVASRLGSPSSGIRAHARGWDIGVAVYGSDVEGSDVFEVYATLGSRNPGERVHIGSVRLDDDGTPVMIVSRPHYRIRQREER